MPTEEAKTKIWLSATIIVTVSTALAYLFTYRYQTGYADVFGIPYDYITIDFTTLLRAGIFIIALLWTIYPWANLMAIFLPENTHPMYKALVYYGVIACYTLLIMFLFKNLWKEWLPYAIGTLIFLVIEFGWPLLTIRGKKTYTQKFVESQDHELPGFFKSLPGRFFRNVGVRGFWIIWGLIMFYSLTYKAGQSAAMRKEDFFLFGDKMEYAVVAIYDDVLILAKFDRRAKEIYRKYMIIKISENPITLTLKKRIGPFQVKDPPEALRGPGNT